MAETLTGFCEHCGESPTCIVCRRGMSDEPLHITEDRLDWQENNPVAVAVIPFSITIYRVVEQPVSDERSWDGVRFYAVVSNAARVEVYKTSRYRIQGKASDEARQWIAKRGGCVVGSPRPEGAGK